MTKNEILTLVQKVKAFQKGPHNALPEQSYFLDNDEILCYPRENGDSRYPYHNDGLVLFAHSDGYIDCTEGLLQIFKCAHYNEDTNIAFFAGEKMGDQFFPISVTGAAHQLFENIVARYTVFTPACVYYVVETEKALFAMRAFVDEQKHLHFSVGAVNLAEAREIYLCSYFEPMLRTSTEDFFARMIKFGELFEQGGYVIKTKHRTGTQCLSVRRSVLGTVLFENRSTAKNDLIANKGGNLTNAGALKSGSMKRMRNKVNTTEIPVVCDLTHFALEEGGFAQISYEMVITQNEQDAARFAKEAISSKAEEEALRRRQQAEQVAVSNTQITFSDWHNEKLHPAVLSNFLRCVQRQVSLCALGKNYAGPSLGIRDVFQQLELSLLWQKDLSRAQIVRVMDYILEDGRPPRQISFSNEVGQPPKMDLRPFIDQGFWIISTLHTYLAYTDDFSILAEECGYYQVDTTYGPIRRSEKRDSLLQHLLQIMSFLISNIDNDTHCMRVLFGDWNDALDALGKTKDSTKEFGNGVSVMATLQMYLAFEQMCEILKHIGNANDIIQTYRALQNKVADGVRQYALVPDETGFVRMVHGWAEDRSYYVGSFDDFDKVSRISLTANAFAGISGIMERFPEYKEDIVQNILSLDSRFGLLTFDKPFITPAPEVGRLGTITPGTYENACTYVHAGTFGSLALFMLGHAKEAWNALEKAMVISHKNVTLTTFIMPNSYCIDGEYDFDGESMGDWYTGSGAVLLKNIIKCGFGIEPTMDAVKIIPAAYFPAKNASLSVTICGKPVTVQYENRNEGTRRILFNGKELALDFDTMRNTSYATIAKKDLAKANRIVVID